LNCQTRATRTGMSPPAAQSGLNCQTRATRTGMSPPAGASPGDRHQPGRPRAAREPPPSRTPPPLIEGASGDASDPRWPTRQTAPRARATARNPPPAYTNRQSPRAHGALSRYPPDPGERASRSTRETPMRTDPLSPPAVHHTPRPRMRRRAPVRERAIVPAKRPLAKGASARASDPRGAPRHPPRNGQAHQHPSASPPFTTPTPTHAQTSPRPRAGGLPGETAAG
jgi:hypothetical protein